VPFRFWVAMKAYLGTCPISSSWKTACHDDDIAKGKRTLVYSLDRSLLPLSGVRLKDEKLGLGLAQTIGLAKYPNVFVKLTSLPSSSSEDHPYRNIHPHLKRLIDAFGPRRCFWGTDLSAMLSRTKCTYRQAVTMFTEEIDFLSNEDLEFVMGRGLVNACRGR
jgi:hypothetical protein